MRVDLALDKKTVENEDWTGLGHGASGPPGCGAVAGRGPRAAGPSGCRAAGPSRAVGRGPAFSKTPHLRLVQYLTILVVVVFLMMFSVQKSP